MAPEKSLSFEKKTVESMSSTQFQTTGLFDPLPPSTLTGESVGQDGRESRGIADAVCITPSPGDHHAPQRDQDTHMGGPPRGVLLSSGVAPEVSQFTYLLYSMLREILR